IVVSLLAERWDPADSRGIEAEGHRGRAQSARHLCPYVPLLLCTLFSDAELVDDRAVALKVGLLEVVQKTAAAADEFHQSAAAVMVLRVRLEMLGQVSDSIREKCDLHFGRPGIAVMRAI